MIFMQFVRVSSFAAMQKPGVTSVVLCLFVCALIYTSWTDRSAPTDQGPFQPESPPSSQAYNDPQDLARGSEPLVGLPAATSLDSAVEISNKELSSGGAEGGMNVQPKNPKKQPQKRSRRAKKSKTKTESVSIQKSASLKAPDLHFIDGGVGIGDSGGGGGGGGGWALPPLETEDDDEQTTPFSSSLVPSKRCQRERRQHEGAWQHAFETRYTRHNVRSSSSSSSAAVGEGGQRAVATTTATLPPIWPVSSVATGPDFECNGLIKAEIKSGAKNAKMARPSWGACALLCGSNGNDCKAARQHCAAEPKCRGVALPDGKGFKGLGILKGDYVWSSLSASTSTSSGSGGGGTKLMREAVRECLGLYSDARGGTGSGGSGSSRKSAEQARAAWMHHGCSDFTRPHWEVEESQIKSRQAVTEEEKLAAADMSPPPLSSSDIPSTSTSTSFLIPVAETKNVRWAIAHGGSPPWLPSHEWGGLSEATTVASKQCRSCPRSSGIIAPATHSITASSSSSSSSSAPPSSSSPPQSSSASDSSSSASSSSSFSSARAPVHLLVVTDRPGSSLCLFLRTAIWAQVKVTILGWAPNSPPRWQEWYLGSKPLVVADYLGRCASSSPSSMSMSSSSSSSLTSPLEMLANNFGDHENFGIAPNATVIVTDSDVLLNVASAEELLAAVEPFMPRIQAGEVVFSAEGPCVTVNVAYRKPLCNALIRRANNAAQARKKGKGSSTSTTISGSMDGLTALNSGLWVGQAWALRRLSRRFAFAARHYIRAVQSPGTYSALQTKMQAVMATADGVTLAVDGPLGFGAAARASSRERHRQLSQLQLQIQIQQEGTAVGGDGPGGAGEGSSSSSSNSTSFVPSVSSRIGASVDLRAVAAAVAFSPKGRMGLGGTTGGRGSGGGRGGGTELEEAEEDEDGDDLSQLVRVRHRYRHDLVSGASPASSSSSSSSSSSHAYLKRRKGSATAEASGGVGSASSSSSSSSSSEGLPFLVNDQSVFYLMLSVEDQSAHGIGIDYHAELFLSMYGSPNRLSLAIDTEHRKRLVVLGAKGDSALALAQAEASSRNEKYLTQAVSEAAVSPAFVHYNGGAKLSKWNVEVGRASLHRTLLAAHRQRRKQVQKHERWNQKQEPPPSTGGSSSHDNHNNNSDDNELTADEVAELDALFPQLVTLVDNHLRRDASVTYSDICPSPHAKK